MATVAQITANRLNALKSTGPRTSEGKRRSARNAVKWGLFSKQVVVTEEEAREWEQLFPHLRTLLQPRDPIEELLADEVAANWLRLARCLKIDGGLFRAYSQYDGRSCGLGTAFAQAAQLDCFGKLSRYEQHLERKLALSLQRLQSARVSRTARPKPEKAALVESSSPEQALIVAGPAPVQSSGSPKSETSPTETRRWRVVIAKLVARWWT
jgi:hypothetical protein